MIPKWVTGWLSWTDEYKFTTRERTLAKFTTSARSFHAQLPNYATRGANTCFNNDLVMLLRQTTLKPLVRLIFMMGHVVVSVFP